MTLGTFEPVRIAVVGCGNISSRYAKSLLSRPDLVTIAGAFDINGERTRSFTGQFGGDPYSTLDALLADERTEAVANMTPHRSHAEVSAAAIKAGKHVHSEKPLATTRKDGKRLLRLAKRAGVRLSCSPFTFLGEGQQTAWKAESRVVAVV